ncbi:hypothetical protein [Sphingomonas sp.]|uniref:hypothetical protein n=1 Tax=Sphingomonas sp. TaxID=28214 RepID=UPI0025D3B1DF|nr:hypothetical protein [Sphingomonas sp.]MBV9529164.1 hypothetical protein [Sphingomonas sp.]
MNRSIAAVSVSMALTIASASLANAQAAPPGAPLPGSGDSAKISAGNRENNAEYNRLVGAADQKAVPKDDSRPAAKSHAVAATAADLKVGSQLRDVSGAHIGIVSQVDPDGVVVDTGTTKIKVPATAFGKDEQGLLLGISAAKFNELIAQAHAGH